MTLPRVPEPEELMDESAQARAYADADFSAANALFIDLLEQQLRGELSGRLLDLGCGPADIPRQLCQRHPSLQIDALDGAQAMLDLALQALDTDPQTAARIRLLREYLPCEQLPRKAYRTVVSNSLLHHLADPAVMWNTIAHSAQAGAQILVMDLLRPASELAVEALVESYAIDEPDVLRTDFRNSLFAAYTTTEVAQQLAAAGLQSLKVQVVSDRHLAVTGRLPD